MTLVYYPIHAVPNGIYLYYINSPTSIMYVLDMRDVDVIVYLGARMVDGVVDIEQVDVDQKLTRDMLASNIGEIVFELNSDEYLLLMSVFI